MLHRTILAGGVDLTVAEGGEAGRPILLLHGFTGAKEDFTRGMEADGGPSALDRLAESGWHVAVPDQRGHGQSGRPHDEASYSTARFAEDAMAVADALGWERFTLLGHSLGGVIAQVAALADPGRIDRLVLMDTSHGPLEGVDRAEPEVATEIVRERGIDGLADLMMERQGENPLDTPASRRLLAERAGWAEFGDRKLRASSAAMYVAMLREIFEQPDRLADLESLSMPVLVIVGEQDTPFLAPSERMAATIPGARLEVIPDAGHNPQFESPDAWWKALGGFLSEATR